MRKACTSKGVSSKATSEQLDDLTKEAHTRSYAILRDDTRSKEGSQKRPPRWVLLWGRLLVLLLGMTRHAGGLVLQVGKEAMPPTVL